MGQIFGYEGRIHEGILHWRVTVGQCQVRKSWCSTVVIGLKALLSRISHSIPPKKYRKNGDLGNMGTYHQQTSLETLFYFAWC